MNLVYPIFLKISYFTKEEFWKRLYENMAYNRPPQCLYIRSSPEKYPEITLVYHHKKRGFIYCISNQEPQQLAQEIKFLLINNMKISSISDHSKYAESYVDFLQWNNLKKNFIKNHLVIKYVIEKLKPSTAEEARLYVNKINLGLSFKTINPKNITLNNNKIEYLELASI